MSKEDLEVSNEQLLERLKLTVDGKLTRAAVLLFHPDRLYLTNAGGLPSGWSVKRLFVLGGENTASVTIVVGGSVVGGQMESKSNFAEWKLPHRKR